MAAKIHITDGRIYYYAAKIMRKSYGLKAKFREGQYEAIESVMKGRRTLVVQRTGWGKSLVYFVCAKMLRLENKGVTLVVSPLIVLMENQRDMAERMNLKCDILNSTTRDRRTEIIDGLVNDQLDVVFVTPETLFASDIQAALPRIKAALFVIDEAHCISDWGHDFRLEYGKLGRVVAQMPQNVAVLAVTATANDRVVNDLKRQLGDNVTVSRGSLTRESLHIDILRLETKAKRYAWLLENLGRLPGTGIIYCLTRRECQELSDFLNLYDLNTMPYYSGNDDRLNDEAIQKFHANQIKAIVATVKLGMGYDKGDISFVIHYQTPGNIVLYYQQIGRAGRNIPDAYAFLMTGGADDDQTNMFFIDTAFPTEYESSNIYKAVADSEGIRFSGIEAKVNCSRARIVKALQFLENDGFVYRDGTIYHASPKKFIYDRTHYSEITRVRKKEMRQMHMLTATEKCLSRFAVNCLDDPEKHDCGKCFRCLGHHVFPGLTLSMSSVKTAQEYIDSQTLNIEPHLKWPNHKTIGYVCQRGICLAKYGASGLGELVREGKYMSGGFSDKLVERAAKVLRPLILRRRIKHMTFIPSLRSDIVKNFARRLALSLKLTLDDLLEKTLAAPQKEMQNGAYQCRNAMRSFAVKHTAVPDRIILVDDVVDSGWTLTACGYKLMAEGCKEVWPFALADSSEV